MCNIIRHSIAILLLATGITGLCSCTKNLTQENLVYYNDFDTQDLKGFAVYNEFGPITEKKFEMYNGSMVFGRFCRNYSIIDIPDLPEHNSIRVEFDLYIHDKWAGNTPGAPDVWIMSFDHNTVLVTTFSNTTAQQAYPNFYLTSNTLPAKAMALETDLPGVCSLKDIKGGTSHYKIVKTLGHTRSSFTFSFNDVIEPVGTPAQNLCNKSWSVDNFRVTAIQY